MIITIDTRWLRNKQIDGIGQVVLNITRNILLKERENKYQLLINDDEARKIIQKYLPSVSNYTFVKTTIRIMSFGEIFSLRKLLKKINTDIFYSPNYITFPFSKSYKTVLTVHDLIPFIFPKTLSKSSTKWKLFYKSLLPGRYLLKKADLIITASKATKNDIIRLFKLNEKRIKVIYNGGNNKPKLIKGDVLNKYSLPPRFMLYVGRLDPYKNLVGLIKAYDILGQKIRDNYKLVIVGNKKSLYYPDLKALVKELNLEKNISFLGYVSSYDLPAIYKAASLFVFPSFYEGFGLPILEAMSYEVPVISSNISSMPEVAGKAALLINPEDIKEIKIAMEKIITDDILRKTLIEKGKKQVKFFTWKKTAENLVDIFRKI